MISQIGTTIIAPSPILLLILLFGGFETWRRWKQRKNPATEEYHRLTTRTRLAIAAVYIGLAVLLALGMDATHLQRTLSDV